MFLKLLIQTYEDYLREREREEKQASDKRAIPSVHSELVPSLGDIYIPSYSSTCSEIHPSYLK